MYLGVRKILILVSVFDNAILLVCLYEQYISFHLLILQWKVEKISWFKIVGRLRYQRFKHVKKNVCEDTLDN